jgi:hypothetical protein
VLPDKYDPNCLEERRINTEKGYCGKKAFGGIK